MNLIEKTIDRLLQTNPFYAHFFLNCEIMYDRANIPTAAVWVSKGNLKMNFNTQFIEKLSVPELCAVIEHETLHLLFNHVGIKVKDLNVKAANIAMDASINQFIQGLPDGCITLERLVEAYEVPMEPLQTWEYYYHKIMSSPKVQHMLETLDQHEFGEGGDPSDAAAVRAAAEAALRASKGNASHNVMTALNKLREGAPVPWQQVLANFVARATASSTQNTRKKINRRFGLDQPGKIKKRELTLGVCADSSGSVSDEAYASFMLEISKISKYCNKIYLLDADCEVLDVTVLKKGSKPVAIRRGRGGTAYSPAINKCVELKVDAIIYFGDMDAADDPVNPRLPFLWVIVGDANPPASFGGSVRI